MCQGSGRCTGRWFAWRRGGSVIGVLGRQIGGKGFSETDKPNYDASFYSKTKAMVEDMLTSFPNVCILRSCHLRVRPRAWVRRRVGAWAQAGAWVRGCVGARVRARASARGRPEGREGDGERGKAGGEGK